MSERERKCSKQRSRRNSPSRPGEEPDEPGGETAIPDGLQNDPERPRSIRNERIDRKNAPSPDKAPGGHIDDQEALRDIEGDSDRGTVVDGAEHDGIHPRSDGNTRGVVLNPLC